MFIWGQKPLITLRSTENQRLFFDVNQAFVIFLICNTELELLFLFTRITWR
jgi:hypothetical protein